MKRSIIITSVACVSLVSSLALAAPASAGGRADRSPVTAGDPVTLADGLSGPLSLALGRRDTQYVSQDFAGLLTKVNPDGTTETLASTSGDGIGAVSYRNGTVYYTQIAEDHSASKLMSIDADGGEATEVADIWAFENEENPDQVNTYGFEGLTQSCKDQFPPAAPPFVPPPEYDGVVDTNPYSTLPLDDGIYVADAGGNAILHVDYDGTIETTAVLPTVDVFATPEIVAAAGFPACAANHDYRFEPVPTDVELGPDGLLYVTSLPGGPEDASLGARGSVYTVDPDSGDVDRVATGFVGATGLAVSQRSGAIYVAELFGGDDGTGQVSVLQRGSGKPRVLLEVTSPAAIELQGGSLYLTTDAFVPDATGAPQPIGKVTRVPLTGRWHSEDSHD